MSPAIASGKMATVKMATVGKAWSSWYQTQVLEILIFFSFDTLNFNTGKKYYGFFPP